MKFVNGKQTRALTESGCSVSALTVDKGRHHRQIVLDGLYISKWHFPKRKWGKCAAAARKAPGEP